MAHTSLITGPERRRRWRAEHKLTILEEAFSPGAVVSDVARQYEVSTSLIYQWRREAMAAQEPMTFVAATVCEAPDDAGQRGADHPVIIVEFARGGRVSISASASPALVTAALRALR